MNNCIDSRNVRRIYMEENVGAELRENVRGAADQAARNATDLYTRVIAFICGVLAFFELPAVVTVCRAVAAAASLALIVRAFAVAVSAAPTFAGVALPLGICVLLAATVLRARPEDRA